MSFESKRNLRPAQHIPMRKLEGVSRELSQVQQNVDEATRKARELPQAQGRRVTVTADAAGDKVVSHGLGRRVRGMQVEEKSAAFTVHKSSAGNSRTVTINFSAAGTAKIWFY